MVASIATVVHCLHSNFDVYIGRRMEGLLWTYDDRWGNPFARRPRALAILAYEDWIRAQPQLIVELPKLRGKRLGCWCAPMACHGDVLAKLVNTYDGDLERLMKAFLKGES